MSLKRKQFLRLLSISAISSALFLTVSFSQNELNEKEEASPPPENIAANKACFDCHAHKHYELVSPDSSTSLTKSMSANKIINEKAFYASNHSSFYCTDCHSPEYEKYPHPLSARFEAYYNCLDCHFQDPTLKHLKFETIQKEYEQSIHPKLLGEKFSCWDCHEPHSYKLVARNADSLKRIVEYTNQICLRCHADADEFSLLTNRKRVDVLKHHDWLPNQNLHFAKVRCSECHSQPSDSLLISHTILPKEKAVRKCVECHSSNSRLMASLYKFQVIQSRKEKGLAGILKNQAYIIGANRNKMFNKISIIISIIVIAGIALHAALRIIKK